MAIFKLIAADVARSVVCVSVYHLGKRLSCAKTAQLIELPFGCLIHVSPWNHILYGESYPPRKGTVFEGVHIQPHF